MLVQRRIGVLFRGNSNDRFLRLTRMRGDFGDGTTGGGASVSHTYANNGGYTVTVTVTDAAGQTLSNTVSATVSAVPLISAGVTASVTPARQRRRSTARP